MSIYSPNSKNRKNIQQEDIGVTDLKSHHLMIPVELDNKDKSIGFFVFDNKNLPVGGQKYLLDITGTPYTPELAGTKVFFGPIMPSLQKNYEKALLKLADSIDVCDKSIHSDETSLWALRIADRMGLSKENIKQIKLAAKLHDIGKVVVPKEILIKPGPLNQIEWEIIRRHPGYGATLLEPAKSLHDIRSLVRSHHERFDGNGYPDKLSGDQIPLGARIISVADAYSTMTIRRIYRKPISIEDAKKELIRCRGTQFDPVVVDHMLELLLVMI